MADDTTTEETAPEPATGQSDETDLGDGGKKALSSERQARRDAETARKAAETALKAAQDERQAQLDQIAKALGLKEDEQPDPVKVAQESAADKAAARNAQTQLDRLRAGLTAGLDPELVELVAGDDADSIAASVAKLAGLQGRLGAGPTRPRPDPSQGIQGETETFESQIAAAQKAGDTRKVLSLKTRQLIAATHPNP